MPKHSAGLLVYRFRGDNLELLLAHMGGPFHASKDNGHWTIPKGEYDESEEPKQVAIREFKEELGIDPPMGEWLDLGEIQYGSGSKKGKIVTAWAVQADLDLKNFSSNTFEIEWPPRSGQLQSFPEIDKVRYIEAEAAKVKLIKDQAEFVDRLTQKIGYQSDRAPERPSQTELL